MTSHVPARNQIFEDVRGGDMKRGIDKLFRVQGYRWPRRQGRSSHVRRMITIGKKKRKGVQFRL